jgi:hypothetical protein
MQLRGVTVLVTTVETQTLLAAEGAARLGDCSESKSNHTGDSDNDDNDNNKQA